MSRKVKVELELTLRDKPTGRGKEDWHDHVSTVYSDRDIVELFLKTTTLNDSICAWLEQAKTLNIGTQIDINYSGEQQIRDNYERWKEFVEKRGEECDKLINDKRDSLSEKDWNTYFFKWNQLIMQEVRMWINLNKSVDQEEFDFISNRRGFDTDMCKFLEDALEYIGLKGF